MSSTEAMTKGALLGALIITVVVGLLFLQYAPSSISSSISNMFNWSDLRFVDSSEANLSVKVGKTVTMYVNIENAYGEEFNDIRLIADFGDYDTSYLRIKINELPVSQLIAEGQTTGNVAIEFTALRMVQGQDTATYSGDIYVYNGLEEKNSKPVTLTVKQ